MSCSRRSGKPRADGMALEAQGRSRRHLRRPYNLPNPCRRCLLQKLVKDTLGGLCSHFSRQDFERNIVLEDAEARE